MNINDAIKLDDEGYAFTKFDFPIWSLANQWEALFKSPTYRNPMQVLMEMTLYRLTQSKEVTQYPQKMNACISYSDIRRQTRSWDHMIKAGENRTTKLKKHLITHSSIDNTFYELEFISATSWY